MTRYVFRDGHFRDRKTGELMVDPDAEWKPVTPAIISDIEPYISPASGQVVGGRSARRDDMARAGAVDARDIGSPTGGKLKNKRFAEKHGLTHLLREDVRHG